MLFVALIQILLATAALAQINISTPPFLARCQAWTITWTGGTAPYYVYIYPVSYLDESSFLERLGPSNEAQIKYSVRATAGKQIRFNVRDSVNPSCEGSAFTDVIAITSGGDKSCFAAFSSQLSLASSMASSSATARNEDSSSNGNTPNTGLVLEVSYVLVFGSLVGILGAYILTTWQSETHKVWAL